MANFTKTDVSRQVERFEKGLIEKGHPPPRRMTIDDALALFKESPYEFSYYNSLFEEDLLFLMATHPEGNIIGRFIASDLLMWGWGGKSAISNKQFYTDLIHLYWINHFENPVTIVGQHDIRPPIDQPEKWGLATEWSELYLSRFFEMAQNLGVLSKDFWSLLFAPLNDPDCFLIDCLFVLEFKELFYEDGSTPVWLDSLQSKLAKFVLPDRQKVRNHLSEGFFLFEEHQHIASAAERALYYVDCGIETHNHLK